MFLITMAGLSSRFFRAGYEIPKYQLLVDSETVFAHAVKSFEQYFSSDLFVFVIRDIYNTKNFVSSEAKKLGIKNFKIVVLDRETEGQAETAYLACQKFEDDSPIYIFNIDTFRYGYKKPEWVDQCDGYLEVFRADGEHWSFVLPGPDNSVLKTTEKERISDLCSDGLYFFRSKELFEKTFVDARENKRTVKNEYYIAPMYNELISKGLSIKYETIELSEIDFCGTPEEYEALLK